MERLMLIAETSCSLVVCCSGRRHYHGPHAYITAENAAAAIQVVDEGEDEKEKDDSGKQRLS